MKKPIDDKLLLLWGRFQLRAAIARKVARKNGHGNKFDKMISRAAKIAFDSIVAETKI